MEILIFYGFFFVRIYFIIFFYNLRDEVLNVSIFECDFIIIGYL